MPFVPRKLARRREVSGPWSHRDMTEKTPVVCQAHTPPSGAFPGPEAEEGWKRERAGSRVSELDCQPGVGKRESLGWPGVDQGEVGKAALGNPYTQASPDSHRTHLLIWLDRGGSSPCLLRFIGMWPPKVP